MRKTTAFMTRIICITLASAVILCGTSASGEVNGTITTAKKVFKGAIRYVPSQKAYAVRYGSDREINVPADQVVDLKVDKPADLDPTIAKVKAGVKPSMVAATLKNIAKKYTSLEHDITATRWLAEAYLKAGQADKGATACEEIARNYPIVGDRNFQEVYMNCLLKTEQYGKLESLLTAVIERAPRPAAAVAQMKRGDMAKQKGDLKAALVDGYLRTVYFFQTEKALQPEALYKTVKTLEEMGRVNDAEKWRKKLLTEYPLDPHSVKLKAS